MKKRVYFMLFMALVTVLPNTVSASLYSDVNDETWYVDSINQLNDYGVMTGNPDGTFSPDKCINRAEILKVLMDVTAPGMVTLEEYNYTDLDDPNQWYYPYVMQATELGYVQGYDDGSFQPGKCVNRVEALKMALETFNIEPYRVGMGWYYEDIDRNQWYFDYFFATWHKSLLPEKHVVSYLSESGWTLKKYLPAEPMPRKEAAALINNLINYAISTNEDKATDATRRAFLNSILTAVESFNIDYGYYPQGVFCIGDESSPNTDEDKLLQDYLNGGSLKMEEISTNPVVCKGEGVRYEELETGYQIFIQVEDQGNYKVSGTYSDIKTSPDLLDSVFDNSNEVVVEVFGFVRD